MRNKILKAFTLSELLIAIGIVGTIAILTIPNIMKDIFAKSYMKKIETTHQTIANAIVKMSISERSVDVTETALYKGKKDFFKKYLKTSKICNQIADCFGETYEDKDGKNQLNTSDIANADDKYYVIMPNKTSVGVLSGGDIPENQILFILDGNGPQKPNKLGEDTMLFFVKSNGSTGPLIDVLDFQCNPEEETSTSSNSNPNENCTTNPDYIKILHADSFPPNGNYWQGGYDKCLDIGMVMLTADKAMKIPGLKARNADGEYSMLFTNTQSICNVIACDTDEDTIIKNDNSNIVVISTHDNPYDSCPYSSSSSSLCNMTRLSNNKYVFINIKQGKKTDKLGTACGCPSGS